MPAETLELKWEEYDQSRQSQGGGLYIWILPIFGNAPFYVGTAACFKGRFHQHAIHFNKCERTFLRPDFRRKVGRFDHQSPHGAFISQWIQSWSNHESMRRSYIFVPGIDERTSAIACEGQTFWQRCLKVLVHPIRPAEYLCPKAMLKRLESRVQYDLEDYFGKLINRPIDFRIPRTRSLLFGKREIDRKSIQELDCTVNYTFQGQRPGCADDFFANLEGCSLR
jgi:hypothetical protein